MLKAEGLPFTFNPSKNNGKTQALMANWHYMRWSLMSPVKLVLRVDWKRLERKSVEVAVEASLARILQCLVWMEPGSGWQSGFGVTSMPPSSNTCNRILSAIIINEGTAALSWQALIKSCYK